MDLVWYSARRGFALHRGIYSLYDGFLCCEEWFERNQGDLRRAQVTTFFWVAGDQGALINKKWHYAKLHKYLCTIFQTQSQQNQNHSVCDIGTVGNQCEYSESVRAYFLHEADTISDLLRFDNNNLNTNVYDSYRTSITGLENTTFSVPLSGIYEMQFR